MDWLFLIIVIAPFAFLKTKLFVKDCIAQSVGSKHHFRYKAVSALDLYVVLAASVTLFNRKYESGKGLPANMMEFIRKADLEAEIVVVQ